MEQSRLNKPTHSDGFLPWELLMKVLSTQEQKQSFCSFISHSLRTYLRTGFALDERNEEIRKT